jgi:hypothetical protein
MAKRKPEDNPEMTVRQIIATFPGDWVLLDITDPSYGDFMAQKGKVLFHHHRRKKVDEVLMAEFQKARAIDPTEDHEFYCLEAVPYATTGDEFREAIEEAIEKELVGGFGRW